MGKAAYDIFISYRRDGGDTLAQLIYDRLTDRGYRVFLDVESLRSGKFNEKLLEVIDQCKDIVVILPPGALERCRNEGDWLYLELSHALKARKNIIPVMMKGFEWTQDIPEELKEIQNFNGIRDSKDYFDAVIDKMTLLLHSRPSTFALSMKKLRRKVPKMDMKTAARKKKKVLAGILIIAAAAAAAWFVPGLMEKEQLSKEASRVTIQLTPDKEMNASEYYEAREILKDRFDILADGESYDFNVDDDVIDVKIPQDVFGDINAEDMLKSYVTRPAELYILPWSEEEDAAGQNGGGNAREENIHVSRNDIKDLSIDEGTAQEIHLDRIDMEKHKIEKAEKYKYLEITFSDETADEIKQRYGDQNVYTLAQDVEEMGTNYYYYPLLRADNDNTFYIVDCWQDDTVYNLVEYNYLHDTFSRAFTFSILMPVQWETEDNAGKKGKFQSDPSDIKKPYVTVQLSTLDEDISEGVTQDIITALKKRMDALEVPYAFGYTVDDSAASSFTIRTGTERISEEMLEMLGNTGDLSVEGAFYKLIDSYDIKEVKYLQEEDGTCRLDLLWDEDSYTVQQGDLTNAVKAVQESDNSRVFLHGSTEALLSDDITDVVGDDRFSFRQVKLFGLDADDERQKYLAAFLKASYDTKDLLGSHFYAISSAVIEVEEGQKRELGIPSADEKKEEEYTEIIQDIYPEAEVTFSGGNLDVSFDIEMDDTLPQKANDMIKQIYEASRFSNGELEILSVYIRIPEVSNIISCSFNRDTYAQHCTTYYGFYYGKQLEPYSEEFRSIVENDPFYTETVKPPSSGGWDFEL